MLATSGCLLLPEPLGVAAPHRWMDERRQAVAAPLAGDPEARLTGGVPAAHRAAWREGPAGARRVVLPAGRAAERLEEWRVFPTAR